MSGYEYSDAEIDLDGFIVSEDEEQQQHDRSLLAEDEMPHDRILDITNTLKPNEDQTQKVLKAHISVLVSALGGPDHTSQQVPAPYKLGQDALACLKDIKRWIKAVDERTNSYDVALACADSGLVVNDLTSILCQWDRKHQKKEPILNARTTEKVMLSCLELLVLLTWPLELTPESSTKQRIAYPNLKKIQITYKKHILAFNKGQTLKAVIRLVLPIVSKPRLDREPRDNAIIRMALFFVRNILFIEPANTTVSSKVRKEIVNLDNMPANVNQDDISLNAVLQCFQNNKVLIFLLTIAGSLGTEFDRQMFGHCTLECIYLIIKRIRPEVEFTQSSNNNSSARVTSEPTTNSATGTQLQNLLNKESKKKQLQNSSVSTRHGRFGSLLSIQGDTTSYVVSGQDALHNTDSSLAKLDSTKKWHHRTTFKYDADDYVTTESEFLNSNASLILREFLDSFLEGGCFNNLIEGVSWLLTSNGDLAFSDPYERAAYFLTVAWFFGYKREKVIRSNVEADYGSVGAGLNETNFVLLLSYFRTSFESKDWSSLHVAMICFREMLSISNSIFSKNREKIAEADEEQAILDKELAEGIIHKLFESKMFLDLIVEIPKTAAKHSPDYLNVSVSVVYIVLKTFESFANEDIALYVKTKRRQSKKKKNSNNLDHSTEMQFRELIEGSGSEDEQQEELVKSVSKERRLDFKETELRFFHPATVSTYIEYLSRYEDLSHEEIKRCLSFFHRLFVVRKDFTNLFRLDFMNLIHKLRLDLPLSSSIRSHVDEFIYYFMKKFKQAFKRFPLPIEILFPRIEDAQYKTYLGSGELHIKEEKAKRPPRLGKDLEFIRDTFSLDEKFKIIITALLEQEKAGFLSWFITELDLLIKKRVLETSSIIGMFLNLTPEYKRLLISNSHIRVFVALVGFELPYIMDENCLLPSSISTDSLCEKLEIIKKWIASQPASFEDGNDASYFLRTKDFEDDEYEGINYRNGGYDNDDESIAFETEPSGTGGSYYGSQLDALDELESGIPRGVARVKNRKRKDKPSEKKKHKKESRRRPPRFNVNSDDEETAHAPVKSAEFVHDSDDESDNEEFFAREERLRQMLESSGGIVNPQQLAEFKQAWSRLEKNNGSISTSVTKAIENTLFVENDHDDEDDVANVEPRMADKDSFESDADSIDGNSQSSNTADFEQTKKRSRSFEESEQLESAEADEAEEEEQHISRKKKRLVISDDEDDDDE
ncbi:topoisomerase 1-associated factor 1 [[Candida] anglica]|uniref:Topoisomerase 1-associated factor 1 n=1 Tax=[Candida] anglica TaxID=148631 RepID=A0ABP0ECX6_9ASCO